MQPEGSAAGAAGEAERTGLHPRALRLPAPDGAAVPPRLEGERQTHLSPYTEEGLIVRTKQRKKIARRQRGTVPAAMRPGQRWSMDFTGDKLADGRGFRILTVVDQFTRECVLLAAERSMSGAKVAEALAIDGEEAAPESITCDNGSEFAGRVLEAWAIEHGVQLVFIRPGRPVENGFIESFNGRCGTNSSMWSGWRRSKRRVASWRPGVTITTINGLTARSPIARRPQSRHCTESKAGASLSPSEIGHSVSRVKGSLRRLTSPLTRAAERPKSPAMRAKRSCELPGKLESLH